MISQSAVSDLVITETLILPVASERDVTDCMFVPNNPEPADVTRTEVIVCFSVLFSSL